MGGYGSGGPNKAGCGTVGQYRSLDVMKLHRSGCLRPGIASACQWSYEDGTSADIRLRAEDGNLILSYRYRRNGGEWQSVEQPVPILWEPCRLGGQRPWFQCACSSNGRYCGRKVGKLYGAGRLFACRHCYRLGYASQIEEDHWRLSRRANKLRQRLGGEPGSGSLIPPKPKGMHGTTYERMFAEIIRFEAEADEAMSLALMNRFARLPRRMVR